jgi:hypothetical protein
MFRDFFLFIHSVFCLTTGPKPPLKRFLHIVWSRAFQKQIFFLLRDEKYTTHEINFSGL